MKLDHQAILEFWYGEWPYQSAAAKRHSKIWFEANGETDNVIREKFEDQIHSALNESLIAPNSLDGKLAYIILTDQFTRNVFRKSPAAFSGDALALTQTLQLIENKQHLEIPATVAAFACMPLQHSEDKSIQQLSINVFNDIAEQADAQEAQAALGYAKYAKVHADIIFEFNRFPHRNDALNRESSPAEIAYLEKSGLRFGQ